MDVTVTVLWFGPLRERVGRSSDRVTTPEGTTMAALYRSLLPEPRLPVGYARNAAACGGDDVVREGDEVVFLPPVGGG